MDGGAFVSYRREDAAGFAGRLCDSLERLLPSEPIFRDVDGLSPGQDFVEAIDARLRQCRVCLAVIGRDWLHARDDEGRRRLDQPGDFVRLELTAALARPEVLVIPVLVEGAVMPPADALPSEIRALAQAPGGFAARRHLGRRRGPPGPVAPTSHGAVSHGCATGGGAVPGELAHRRSGERA